MTAHAGSAGVPACTLSTEFTEAKKQAGDACAPRKQRLPKLHSATERKVASLPTN